MGCAPTSIPHLKPQGTLAQIYLMEPGQPDYVVLGVLCAFFGGAMLVGSGQTLNGLKNGTLSIRCDLCVFNSNTALPDCSLV